MSIRRRTYIAGDWDGDHDLIEAIYAWNESSRWSLSFPDAHELAQARDSSLNCSIKSSLRERLARSNRFVLVVGKKTKTAHSGSCAYCADNAFGTRHCRRNHPYDPRSYIEFECEYAARHIENIVVIYNSTHVDRTLCPKPLRYKGTHIAALEYDTHKGKTWCYQSIREAINR